jgi:hypothetical protein
MKFLSLMVPSTSGIVSVSTLPSGQQLQDAPVMQNPRNPGRVPWLAKIAMNASDAVNRSRAWRWGAEYQYIFLDSNGEDLEHVSAYVEKGLLKPVVGSRARLDDIDSVRELAGLAFKGKGGLGKAIITVR